MKHVRLYQNACLKIGAKLVLDDYGSHHLSRVLRFPQGQDIVVFNGDGFDYIATVLSVKKHCEVEIHECVKNQTESLLDITLAQGVAKGEKMDFLIQKAVELGVKRITPILSNRCVVKLKGDKLKKRHQHWQKIVIGACEQSGRSVIPILDEAVCFDEFIQTVDNGFVLHHRANQSLLEVEKTTKATLIIGPEGGLTGDEIQSAIGQNCQPLLLGSRVLRTETASLAAIANMQLLWGS